LKQRGNIEQERRKRRRELLVALFGVLLVAIITLVEYRMAGSAEGIPMSGHLLLFVLLSLVILLLIVIIFFLIRNVFKLLFERRRKVLGSNLKTRLTLAFVALTLVPTIVLFIASAGVVHTTIESWFKAQVEESLQSSLVVAQAYYKGASDNVLNVGARLVSLIEGQGLAKQAARERLHRKLEEWRKSNGISAVQINFHDGGLPIQVKDAALGSVVIPPPRPSFLKIGYMGDATAKILPLGGGSDLIRGIVPIRSGKGRRVSAVLVVDHYIPTSLAARLFAISNAFGDYQEAKRMRGPVKTIYVLILLVVALLVLLIGFWIGMTIARDITDPIESLAEGTEKIAAGDLDVYIEPVADDELGTLVRSFNKMTGDLRATRDELLRVNIDLDGRRKYMETVLKNVAAGVLAVNSEGTVTAVNNSAVRLLGIEVGEILDRPLMDVLPDVSASAAGEILEDLSGTDAITIERQLTLSFPNGAVSLICFANSLKDEEGADLGVVFVFEDMTHLVKAQRVAAWRDVARRIAHEIKNPLTPIQLNAQRIRRKYMDKVAGDNAVLDRCTAAIVDQVDQLKNMVNEFSRFARMPSANPTPENLNGLVGKVVELYRQGNDRIDFTFHPDPEAPILNLDREQIKRAMVNLLDNASAAIEGEGKVSVATRYDRILDMVSIEVVDNGRGLRAGDKDRLFEPYFSTKPGGTGLGLTIVNTIVADHNGFIRVKDNEGGGARFIIELPVRPASNPAGSRPARSREQE
jgi:two-component system nitrogen regulation sensor histidine kinase NtrY